MTCERHDWARYGPESKPFLYVGEEPLYAALELCKRCGATEWRGAKDAALDALFPERKEAVKA